MDQFQQGLVRDDWSWTTSLEYRLEPHRRILLGRAVEGRKREVVLRLLRGESIEALSRELGIEIYRLEQWREKALLGIDVSLKVRQGDPVQAELDQAMQRIGKLTMENELLWQRVRKPGP